VSLLFYFHYFKQFFRLYGIKSLYIVLAIFLLRSLKNSSDSKSMRVTSLSTSYENFNVDLLSKIVYYVISSTYIIKEIEKLVSCVYGVIMHLGNVGRILEKRVKHSATPRILHSSLVFSQHSPRALSHHKRTRLVFYFLIKHVNAWSCRATVVFFSEKNTMRILRYFCLFCG
jgi:hypothetical protein